MHLVRSLNDLKFYTGGGQDENSWGLLTQLGVSRRLADLACPVSVCLTRHSVPSPPPLSPSYTDPAD